MIVGLGFRRYVMVGLLCVFFVSLPQNAFAGACEDALAKSVKAEQEKCELPPSPACLEAAEDNESFNKAYETCKTAELQGAGQGAGSDDGPALGTSSCSGKLYGLCATAKKSGLPNTDKTVAGLVGQLIQAALSLVATIFFLLMVYGGFLWMTSRGSTEQVGKAKTLITQAIVGVALISMAWAITNFVISRLS